ncbi:MAG: DUF547 domain-containing protein [Acidobacteriota bacterium]
MRNGLIVMLLLLAPWPASGEDFDLRPFVRHDAESSVRLEYDRWASFLGAHVRADADGIHRVDYGAVGESEKERLAADVEALAAVDPATLPRDEQMAFWINLYNALTVKTVLEHYPVDSIKEIALPPAGPGGGPWDAPLVEVLGRALSLNDIEHRILRPIWADERIHYAVNCAAVGCPNLAAVPFTGPGLDEHLDRAAAAFISHPRAVRFDGDRLVLSSIFDWYGADFGDREELLEHLAEHADGAVAERVETFSGEIVFEYDWDLNDF